MACFSLAAKMEEPEVPLLLDLQVSDPRFVFEPKSIQRMELLIMQKLQWRLRSVTPFDFLHYFIVKLPQSSSTNHDHLHWKCSDIIVKTIRGNLTRYPIQVVRNKRLCCYNFVLLNYRFLLNVGSYGLFEVSAFGDCGSDCDFRRRRRCGGTGELLRESRQSNNFFIFI